MDLNGSEASTPQSRTVSAGGTRYSGKVPLLSILIWTGLACVQLRQKVEEFYKCATGGTTEIPTSRCMVRLFYPHHLISPITCPHPCCSGDREGPTSATRNIVARSTEKVVEPLHEEFHKALHGPQRHRCLPQHDGVLLVAQMIVIGTSP